jgi:hypothetical protein
MDTDPRANEAVLEPERDEIEEKAEAQEAPAEREPLTVGNGSQVIAVTINLNLPIFGSVVYATRRAIPPAVGRRVFDVVRRVVGTSRPEEEPGEGEHADEPKELDPDGSTGSTSVGDEPSTG